MKSCPICRDLSSNFYFFRGSSACSLLPFYGQLLLQSLSQSAIPWTVSVRARKGCASRLSTGSSTRARKLSRTAMVCEQAISRRLTAKTKWPNLRSRWSTNTHGAIVAQYLMSQSSRIGPTPGPGHWRILATRELTVLSTPSTAAFCATPSFSKSAYSNKN